MKVELHCHTTRYSACATESPSETMANLVRLGYDAVYLTEHNAVWPDDELHALQAEHPGLLILPGVELSIRPEFASDLLLLGTNDPDYLDMHDPAEVLAKARAENVLSVLAHPFRYEGADDLLEQGFIPDAIEHRTCNQDELAAALSRDTADQLGVPYVNAGDVHFCGMAGRYWIETHRAIASPTDIRQVVLDGAYDNVA